ncbi:DUF4426 domain-containing protein [Neptunicella marina]|uniref:DUF4426 domain-containing protein n=1 Tax=Neptunicella marina TaxID=2125989 RepID=A0A8J6J190_9ALTE|nr:DUF4426 domain-containing protein [Neptunicella marina]MBC3767816.1 DUF4426 domain-containing protein [Neptunicella marina]
MIKQTLLLLVVCFGLVNSSANAEQFEKLGNWDVHYIVLPSTFIAPDIAKNYQIQRSKYQPLVNISVLDSESKDAQSVAISGTATNLLGQVKQLEFQQVKEQNAIYYLAQFNVQDEELWRFNIEVRHGNQTQILKFKQKIYVE